MTSSEFGKQRRMNRIIHNGKMLIVPVDDSLIFGPFGGLYDIKGTIAQIEAARPSAILGCKASLSMVISPELPLILNLTASTTTGNHVSKVITGSVLDALKMDVDCVAVHVNYTSEYENQMLQQLSLLITDADQYGVPVVAISYPRKAVEDKDYNYDDLRQEEYTRLICHCTRTSVELGADIIKTQYTGSTESFKRVVESAMGRPVVIAGGPMKEISEAYSMAKSVIDAGGAGISYGRNVFNQKNIGAFLAGIKEIVFNGADVRKAMETYRGYADV